MNETLVMVLEKAPYILGVLAVLAILKFVIGMRKDAKYDYYEDKDNLLGPSKSSKRNEEVYEDEPAPKPKKKKTKCEVQILDEDGYAVDCCPVTFNREGVFFIGRSKKCDLQIDSTYVGGRHAVIGYDAEEGYFLKDLESKNGTYYKGQRVNVLKLKDGTKFKIAATRCKFARIK